MPHQRSLTTILSVLIILLIISSLTGILDADIYYAEKQNWRLQALGQDIIDLSLIAPILVVLSILIRGKKQFASLLLCGVLMYLVYTFTIYCFSVHFNKLFIIYCSILGISGYLLFKFLVQCFRQSISNVNSKWLLRINGIYFMLIAVTFSMLWLSEIIPAIINNTFPASLTESGLFINPVHVLDLSIVLPLIFISGIKLIKKNKEGLIIAPVLLTFFILMDATIAFLIFFMNAGGLGSELTIAFVMIMLSILSLILLIMLLRSLSKEDS